MFAAKPTSPSVLVVDDERALETLLSGVALVDEVERRDLQTPVILMSASLDDLDEGDSRIDRLAGVVAKPLLFDTVHGLLQATIGRSE